MRSLLVLVSLALTACGADDLNRVEPVDPGLSNGVLAPDLGPLADASAPDVQSDADLGRYNECGALAEQPSLGAQDLFPIDLIWVDRDSFLMEPVEVDVPCELDEFGFICEPDGQWYELDGGTVVEVERELEGVVLSPGVIEIIDYVEIDCIGPDCDEVADAYEIAFPCGLENVVDTL